MSVDESQRAATDRGAFEVCSRADLIPFSGIAVLHGRTQVAIFYLPGQSPELYAIGNYDPCSNANVLSRGIVGDRGGELVVASPLYKQHFSLRTGRCLEHPELSVPTYPVSMSRDIVTLCETSGR